MSLLCAHQTLLESGRPRGDELHVEPPGPALVHLIHYVEDGGKLSSAHPWELAPHVCRELEDRLGYTPPGGWSRLAGLAAGAGVLHATTDGFHSIATVQWLLSQPDGLRPRMVEAFTTRMIPPAAAAALYVALDLHPLWGLELGRDLGACEQPPHGLTPGAETALPVVRDLVFGTLTGLLTALRCVDVDRKYPLDALGEVLWQSVLSARTLACADAQKHAGLPVFADNGPDERRMLSTRLAIADLLDFVFVPAGVARRDDGGWFAADPDALMNVDAGAWGIDQQVSWWNDALVLQRRKAC